MQPNGISTKIVCTHFTVGIRITHIVRICGTIKRSYLAFQNTGIIDYIYTHMVYVNECENETDNHNRLRTYANSMWTFQWTLVQILTVKLKKRRENVGIALYRQLRCLISVTQFQCFLDNFSSFCYYFLCCLCQELWTMFHSRICVSHGRLCDILKFHWQKHDQRKVDKKEWHPHSMWMFFFFFYYLMKYWWRLIKNGLIGNVCSTLMTWMVVCFNGFWSIHCIN